MVFLPLDISETQGLYMPMKPKTQNYSKLELLAPAGSLQSFFAAVESGADAVFCGLKTFSARAKAKNFTMEELVGLAGYAHKLNKKIYVALNTLVKEDELSELISVLSELEYLGVDGLIIQDLGLYRVAHKYFPKIPLHASTQMVIHNLAGVKILEKMGFERVVLARELSLAEISYISENSNLEIEHFIHGALCYSLSGHCLFSSYIDGRSGNRGRCIQPCRRRYHHDNDSGFYFSTSDLSAIELIPNLASAGVMSLKIEGRMKSPEYVAAVVSAYRTVIDAGPGDEKNAVKRAKEQLETAMGRKSTSGFLHGPGSAEILMPARKGGIGRIIGRVERLHGDTVSFKTSGRIQIGDRLRIQPGNDRAGQGFTVRTLFLKNKSSSVAEKDSFVSITLPKIITKGRVSVGDLVFMLVSGQSFTMSEEACLRKIKTAPVPARSINLCIQCNEADSIFTVMADCNGNEVVKVYPVDMVPANRSPLKKETLLKIFSQTGHPELVLENLKAKDLPSVVIKPSRLKEIRRDFYAMLDGILKKRHRKDANQRLCVVQSDLCVPGNLQNKPASSQLYIVTDQQDDLHVVKDHPDLKFIFPLRTEFLEAALKVPLSLGEEKKRLFWDLPSVIFDDEWSNLQQLVDRAVVEGFSGFRFNNLSHFELVRSVRDGYFIAGPWLYALNSQAIDAIEELGGRCFSLSIEDDRENLSSLLQGKTLGKQLVTVYSPVDLFTSRIALPVEEKNGVFLKNDRGEKLHLTVNRGLTITQADKAFSLIGLISELQEMGCCNFVLDLRGTGLATPGGQEIMMAYAEDRTIPGTILLNYEKGLI
ncbi:collagenase-like protease [Desulfocapsa sulfexigens DSM 10523]|uniref:Collagenase-like protease n=2 Tax=Desulfocapsa TaxID=53318 RepID=M1PBT1_DESSD|nr:collagenase-like protease [Desulfocapsa sulfexigens DSM 10523]